MKMNTPKRKTAAAPANAARIYCTVCPKWEIKRPERCSNTLDAKVKGRLRKLYFCTRRCKERYLTAPEKFRS